MQILFLHTIVVNFLRDVRVSNALSTSNNIFYLHNQYQFRRRTTLPTAPQPLSCLTPSTAFLFP